MANYDTGLLELKGYPISWVRSDLPVGCFFDSQLESEIIAAYRIVAVELNHQLNKDVVDLGAKWAIGDLPITIPRGYIAITSFTPVPGTVGETLYGCVCHTALKDRILSAEVKIRRGLDSGFLLTIMRHEMGHVLGLAHDDLRSSIMSRSIGINPPPDAQFTDHDIALLKKLYA